MKQTIFRIVLLLSLLFGVSIPAIAQDVQTQSLTLTVNPGVLTFTNTTLPNGQTGLAYTGVQLTVTGGLGPYSFSVTSGQLPAGILLSPSGVFSGTPSVASTGTFTVQAADSEVPQSKTTATFTITVQNPLVITTATLPPAVVGTPYSTTISFSGGVAPYTCALVSASGNLPPGLVLNPAVNNSCAITGTPTSGGSFTFVIQVTDSAIGPPAKARVRVTGNTVKH